MRDPRSRRLAGPGQSTGRYVQGLRWSSLGPFDPLQSVRFHIEGQYRASRKGGDIYPPNLACRAKYPPWVVCFADRFNRRVSGAQAL